MARRSSSSTTLKRRSFFKKKEEKDPDLAISIIGSTTVEGSCEIEFMAKNIKEKEKLAEAFTLLIEECKK